MGLVIIILIIVGWYWWHNNQRYQNDTSYYNHNYQNYFDKSLKVPKAPPIQHHSTKNLREHLLHQLNGINKVVKHKSSVIYLKYISSYHHYKYWYKKYDDRGHRYRETNHRYFKRMTYRIKKLSPKLFAKYYPVSILRKYKFNPYSVNKRIQFINNSGFWSKPFITKELDSSYNELTNILSEYRRIYMGELGEDLVADKLKYNCVRDVNLPFHYHNGSLARDNNQNDIVTINDYGAFSFEVKNYNASTIWIDNNGCLNWVSNVSHRHRYQKKDGKRIYCQIRDHKKALMENFNLPLNCVHAALIYIKNHGTKWDYIKDYSEKFNIEAKTPDEINSYIESHPTVFNSSQARSLDSQVKNNREEPFPHIELDGDYIKELKGVRRFVHGVNKIFNLVKWGQNARMKDKINADI